ncbi:MAG: alpha/beta hydrolase [Candidatus Velthaea sp.]
MTVLVERGYRCIAYDKRGFGRSELVGHGFDYDTFADDLAALIRELDLRDLTLVGHSMGAGEIARYLTRHGTERVAAAVFAGTVTPFMLQTHDNPDGVPAQAMQQVIESTKQDRPRYFAEIARDFFAPGVSAEAAASILDLSIHNTPLRTSIECSRFLMSVRTFSIPTLVIHGDADTFTPLALTAQRTAAGIPGCTLLVYEGASHGLIFAEKERFTEDIGAFVASVSERSPARVP